MMSKIIQKQNDSTKYNRINQIYEMLKNNVHGFTIAELANELDVSTKTIQRDLYEVLSDLGAIKEGRTWKIDPKLASDDLNTKERLILGILDEMAKSAGNIFYSKAHSLLSQITQQLEHPIFTNVNGEYLEDKTVALFEQIEIAIKEKKEIKFKIKNPWRGKLIDNENVNRFTVLQLLELFNCLVLLRDYPAKWSCSRINFSYFSNGAITITSNEWTKNPQYLFTLTKKTYIRIVLRKSGEIG